MKFELRGAAGARCQAAGRGPQRRSAQSWRGCALPRAVRLGTLPSGAARCTPTARPPASLSACPPPNLSAPPPACPPTHAHACPTAHQLERHGAHGHVLGLEGNAVHSAVDKVAWVQGGRVGCVGQRWQLLQRLGWGFGVGGVRLHAISGTEDLLQDDDRGFDKEPPASTKSHPLQAEGSQ